MTNNFNYYYCCKHAPSHHPTPGSDEMSAPQIRAPQQVPGGGYARRMMELWTSIVETEEQQKKQELFDKGPLTVEASPPQTCKIQMHQTSSPALKVPNKIGARTPLGKIISITPRTQQPELGAPSLLMVTTRIVQAQNTPCR
ncbi:uncharacterized protein LOC117191643 [Drosophila miranda]|uniref:uncharacterized protein LOC117191643 n=1 Tax=Drosophila miranda TaxID=7229 RepID=UPI00143F2313|nr:uncharacterized protein LOC117191643 [Drosophila miranda]